MRRLARSPCKKVIHKAIPESLMVGTRILQPAAALAVTALATPNSSLDPQATRAWNSVSPSEATHIDRR